MTPSPPDSDNPNRGQNEKNKSSLPAWMGFGLVMGIAVGAAIGAATDDMGTWVGVGVALGTGCGAAGAAIQNNRNRGG